MRNSLGVLIAALLGAQTASAAGVTFLQGDVEATTEEALPGASRQGCVPAWVELHNTTPAPQQIIIEFDAFHVGSQVVRRVSLDGNERRVVSVPIPAEILPGTLKVRVPSLKLEGTHALNVIPGSGDRPYLVLGTEDQYRAIQERAPGQPQPIYFDRRHLPDQLAAYTGAAGVLLLDRSATDLDKGQRAALESYVLTGGTVVFGPDIPRDATALDQWRGPTKPNEKTPASWSEPLGFGTVSECLIPATCPEVLPSWRRGSVLGASYAGRLIPGVGRTPIGAFLVIILLFALAIGPGNLAFARKHGRHTLLLTIPLLAFTTCTGIAAYGVAADGLFTTHAAAQSITLLDTDQHRATTLAITGLYAALGPSELHQTGTTIDLLGEIPDHILLDWSDGQLLRGNVIPSRSYRERATATVAPSRARLVLSGHEVENALGGHLKQGFVRVGGVTWQLPELGSGARGELREYSLESKKSSPIEDTVNTLGHRFTPELLRPMGINLEDSEFLAILTDGDYAPTGGLRVTWHPSLHLVRGKVSQ